MPYINGTETFVPGVNVTHETIFDHFRKFLTGVGQITFTGTSAPTLTGHGELTDVRCGTGFVNDETITVTCITDTDPNAPVFSVVGSVSGAMPNATGGVAYSNAGIRFTIRLERDNDNSGAPDVAYVTGDVFTFDVKGGALVTADIAWEVVRDHVATGVLTAPTRGVLFRGRGAAGTDSIYIDVRCRADDGNSLYWWDIESGRVLNLDNTTYGLDQTVSHVSYTLWEGDTDYYIIANGRRFIVATRLGNSGVTTCCYGGFILPYALPSEYTYPVFIGGSSGDQHYSHASTAFHFRAFFDGDRYSSRINSPTQSWTNVGNLYYVNSSSNGRSDNNDGEFIDPWHSGYARSMTTTPGGQYPIINSVISSNSGYVLGSFDGVYYTPGEAPLSSFDTLTVGGDTYLVVSNHQYLGLGDFAALKLE